MPMQHPEPVCVVHMTSVHVLTDIRIHAKECRTLAQAGYHVVLVGPGESHRACCPGEPDVIGVQRPRGRLERMLVTTWRVFRAALNEHGTIYHAHDPELIPWLLVLKGLGKIVVFDMHEDMPNLILTKPWVPRPLRRMVRALLKVVERVLLRGMSVICVVDSAAAEYAWLKHVTTVKNFPIVGELMAIQEEQQRVFTLAYIGTVCPERGSVTLLQAARLCREKGINLAIDLVGAVPEHHRRELACMAGKLGLHVRIHGPLAPSESWRIAARAHLGVALIKHTPGLLRALPTKLLEYMALSKPVIASRQPLAERIVAETGGGICVDPDDTEAVAHAIEEIAMNTEHWREAGRRAKEIVIAKWTWEQESAKLLRLYEDLMTAKVARVRTRAAQAH